MEQNAATLREDWLNRAMPMIREHFAGAGFEVPEKIRLTCGFPSKMGMGRKKRRIGECWDSSCTTDGYHLIFISPVLGDPIKVLGTQVHEVVHAAVGTKHGHKAPFSKAAKAVGLIKPWTSTKESDDLVERINRWIKGLGPYPHGALDPKVMERETEKGRMLLMECECGLKIRTTQKWLDRFGPKWPCPCGAALVNSEMAEIEE